MSDPKLPARRGDQVPSVLSDIGRPGELTRGNHRLGTQRGVLQRNTAVVNADTAYLKAREHQHDQYGLLIDAKMRIVRKIAELSDLPSVIIQEQQQREHNRALATLNAAHEMQLTVARHEIEIAKTREQAVRAQRNLDAAQRVRDVEIDKWYAEAQARANNATAEYQDTLTDLQRGQPDDNPAAAADAASKQRAADLALLDHQIDLERQRGNQAAVLALLNVRARLQRSP